MVKYKQTVEKGEKAGKKLSLLTHDTKDVGVSRSLNEEQTVYCSAILNKIPFKVFQEANYVPNNYIPIGDVKFVLGVGTVE